MAEYTPPKRTEHPKQRFKNQEKQRDLTTTAALPYSPPSATYSFDIIFPDSVSDDESVDQNKEQQVQQEKYKQQESKGYSAEAGCSRQGLQTTTSASSSKGSHVTFMTSKNWPGTSLSGIGTQGFSTLSDTEVTDDRVGDPCPRCKIGKIKLQNRNDDPKVCFLACTRYGSHGCRWTKRIKDREAKGVVKRWFTFASDDEQDEETDEQTGGKQPESGEKERTPGRTFFQPQ